MKLSTSIVPLKTAWLCQDCDNISVPSKVNGNMRCGACGSSAVEPVCRWVKPVLESFHVWVRPGVRSNIPVGPDRMALV